MVAVAADGATWGGMSLGAECAAVEATGGVAVGGEAVGIVHGSGETPLAEGPWSLAERAGLNLCLQSEADLQGVDGRMGFYLDAILPRVTELATTSMSYREKVAHPTASIASSSPCAPLPSGANLCTSDQHCPHHPRRRASALRAPSHHTRPSGAQRSP